MLVGQAWLPDGAVVTPDAEHDDVRLVAADVQQWPEHADEPLRRLRAALPAAGLMSRITFRRLEVASFMHSLRLPRAAGVRVCRSATHSPRRSSSGWLTG